MALIWITYETLSESNLYSDYGYPLRAPFKDVRQLKLGSDVRMSGVSIGAVTDMHLEGTTAIVTLNIEGDFLIPKDSTATIRSAGLLGNNYIGVEAGSSPHYFSEGDTINTKLSPDINAVIAQVGNLGERIGKFMDSFAGEGSADMFGGLGELVQENRPKIQEFLDNMVSVSQKLNEGEGTLAKIINDEGMYDKFLLAADDISSAAQNASVFFDDAKIAVTKLDRGEGPLDFLVNDKQSAEKLKTSVDNIHQFTEKLNGQKNTIGKLINDQELYDRAQGILTKVEGAVEGIENSGPITAVGVTAGTLF
jgi:phospholipid/cholesterol/gamma-HCH transport system substrate-binding protein